MELNQYVQNKGIQDFAYLSTKFLLKLPYKPGMNFVETFPQPERSKCNHSLAVGRNIDLTVDDEKR